LKADRRKLLGRRLVALDRKDNGFELASSFQRGEETMARLALRGTGIMGGPIAQNLLRAGHKVIVWNRTEEKARTLEPDGARS
jgi:shikimate 5-dehydrogenase